MYNSMVAGAGQREGVRERERGTERGRGCVCVRERDRKRGGREGKIEGGSNM